MRRVTRPGGLVAGYVWDYAGEMQMMRRFWDAAVALDRGAVPLDEGRRFPVCRPEPLATLSSLIARRSVPLTFRRSLRILTTTGGYCMSLSEERRAVLRERIRENLPARADGTIHLMARAWAVRGTKL
jgi:hypothetical protein